jgi:hypothetical protein
VASPARRLLQAARALARGDAPDIPPGHILPCRLAAGWRPACPHCGKRRGTPCQGCRGANWPALPPLPLRLCPPALGALTGLCCLTLPTQGDTA